MTKTLKEVLDEMVEQVKNTNEVLERIKARNAKTYSLLNKAVINTSELLEDDHRSLPERDYDKEDQAYWEAY